MFQWRPDGVVTKNIPAFYRIIPCLMKKRSDALNYTYLYADCGVWDEFIKRKEAETGKKYTYNDIILAGSIRTVYNNPKMNRFVINGRIYQRHCISTSVTVMRSLRGDDSESTIRLDLKGNETIEEIKDKYETLLREQIYEVDQNATDKLAKILMATPTFLARGACNLLMWLDKHNLLPKAVVNASPFHTTFWVTNLKSLGVDAIQHHIYDFGTCSQYLSFGKEKYVPRVVGKDKVEIKKFMEIGYVMDERICDGLSYARGSKTLTKYLNHPDLLCEHID